MNVPLKQLNKLVITGMSQVGCSLTQEWKMKQQKVEFL